MAAALGQDCLPSPEGSLRISRHQKSDSGIFAQVNDLAFDLDKRRESGERANRCGHQLVVCPTHVDLITSPGTKAQDLAALPGRWKSWQQVDCPGLALQQHLGKPGGR